MGRPRFLALLVGLALATAACGMKGPPRPPEPPPPPPSPQAQDAGT
jgi:hypothetical protein